MVIVDLLIQSYIDFNNELCHCLNLYICLFLYFFRLPQKDLKYVNYKNDCKKLKLAVI